MEVVEEEREVKERESYRQDAGIPFNSYNLRNREIRHEISKVYDQGFRREMEEEIDVDVR